MDNPKQSNEPVIKQLGEVQEAAIKLLDLLEPLAFHPHCNIPMSDFYKNLFCHGAYSEVFHLVKCLSEVNEPSDLLKG